jgi:hypothetical protein
MERMSMDTVDIQHLQIHAPGIRALHHPTVLNIALLTFQLTQQTVHLTLHAIWLMVTVIVIARQTLHTRYSVDLVKDN